MINELLGEASGVMDETGDALPLWHADEQENAPHVCARRAGLPPADAPHRRLSVGGVRYRPVGASTLLRDNLLIYGLGGIIVPFIGIKLIDLLLMALHLV
jgi:hypothetical protein